MRYTVKIKHVVIKNKEGGWTSKPLWSRAKVFVAGDLLTRIKNAIRYAHRILNEKQTGTVIYINDIPIYHTKWGNDGQPFSGWKPNPVAEYWRRQVKR